MPLTYSRRVLVPFHGMLQVVEVEGGTAESADGVSWRLYIADERIIAHTGLSEIRFGTWTAEDGYTRARVRGTFNASWLKDIGERLIEAVEASAGGVPFAPSDCHELWLLDEEAHPLALLESTPDRTARGPADTPHWHPGAAAKEQFHSPAGGASTMEELLRQRAGRRPVAWWVERSEDGAGVLGDGGRIAAADFPELLISTRWPRPAQTALVQAFLEWQAPWLLQLPHLTRATRARLEPAAWRRALETSRVFRLFPQTLDPEGLRVARVQARLLGQAPAAADGAEPVYPFYIE